MFVKGLSYKRCSSICLALCLVAGVLLCATPAVHGQAQARIVGEVTDPDGNPVRDAVVTVEALERAFEVTATTNKKGKFVLSVLDGTWDFKITISKEGFALLEEPVEAKPGGISSLSWILEPGSSNGDGLNTLSGEIEGERPVVKAYERGAEAFAEGNFEGALEGFGKAVELDPELKEGYHALAMTHHNLGQSEKAIEYVERFESFGVSNVDMQTIRFDALEQLGRLDEAMVALDGLIEMAPGEDTARRAFNMGVKFYQNKDLETAIELLSKAATTDPELLQAHRVLAQVLASERRYEEALVHADHALAINPEDADGLLVRYESLRGLDRPNEGESSLEKLKASDPVKFVQTFMRVGLKEFELGQNDSAIRSFRRVMEADSDHPRGNYHLGVALVSAGETEEGVAHLKRFMELAPEDPEVPVAQEMLSYLN